MRTQIVLIVVCLALATAFALLNPDLLYQPSMLNTGFGRVVTPSITVLLVFAAASWILLLASGVFAEWRSERRMARMTETLAQRDREILQLKASAFDQLQDILRSRMPVAEEPAVIGRRRGERKVTIEPQPTAT